MENQLSEILDSLLGLLLLEGSYEIEEKDEAMNVSIETGDAGRLIGARGESLESLQLIINQIIYKKVRSVSAESQTDVKRVIVDVLGWRKQKEEELTQRAKDWVKEVLETGKEVELEPMSSWQRRVIHMVVAESEGVESESVEEGRDRHIVIRIKKNESEVKLVSARI